MTARICVNTRCRASAFTTASVVSLDDIIRRVTDEVVSETTKHGVSLVLCHECAALVEDMFDTVFLADFSPADDE